MGWQDFVAVAVVFGAATYLISLVWRGLAGEKAGSCGTACGKCSSGKEAEPVQVVAIGPAPASRSVEPARR